MALIYNKTTWQDYVAGSQSGTTVNASRMNNIENQVEALTNFVNPLNFSFLEGSSININDYHGSSYYGHYYCNGFQYISSSSTQPSNPGMYTATTSFYLDVLPLGSQGQTLQRLMQCNKSRQYTWERVFYSNSWGIWKIVPIDEGWTTFTLNSGISADVKRYKKTGNMVTLQIYNCTGWTPNSSDTAPIYTLPSGYRPAHEIRNISPSNGTTYCRYEILTSGHINIFNTTNGTATGRWTDILVTFPID